MLSIRPYKADDAEKIVTWCQNEDIFRKWGGNHFGTYPLTAEQFNKVYMDENGHCQEKDNFFPMTAFDEDGICGHFIMRYLNGDKRFIRFGWVIVSPDRRGKGYGKEMLGLGLKFARELYHADKFSIGVLEDNDIAHNCYLSLGFKDVGKKENVIEMEML